MRRTTFSAGVLIIITAIVLSGFVLAPSQGDAQDNTEGRVAALETQVAALNSTVALLTANVATVMAGASTGRAEPTAVRGVHTITGQITLFNPYSFSDDPKNYSAYQGVCSGRGGYDDIEGGNNVVLTDGSGRTIATGTTSVGHETDDDGCQFDFLLHDVPDSDFYTITIGRRGGPTYSYADLEAANWTIELSIGR